MNDYVKKRKILTEIYDSRDVLLKDICNEIDTANNFRNFGNAFYAHVKQTLIELESGVENIFLINKNLKLSFPKAFDYIKSNFDFELPVSGIDMTSIHSIGVFEPAETVLIKRIAHLFETFFDVGANIGYHSFLFSTFSNPKSKIYAFEPEDFNHHRLKKAIEKNEMEKNIFPYKVALSDSNEEIKLLINKRGAGGHTLINYQSEILCEETETIQSFRLDDFVETNKISFDKAILKIDVEGAEIKVLSGATQLIESGKFPVVLCEVWSDDKTGNKNHYSVFKLLQLNGYIAYTINNPSKGNNLISETFQNTDFNKSYNDNYVFIKKDRNDIASICLKQFNPTELHSINYLQRLVDFQEECLIEALKVHAQMESYEKKAESKYLKLYISASDGGYPILKSDECNAEKARRRFHHNCGGPALLSLILKDSYEIKANVFVGNSRQHKDSKGHYSISEEYSTEIVCKDVEVFKPNLLLLMPNNVTSFTTEKLSELKKKHELFIAARDGDPSSYQEWRIAKILDIAKAVDLFITVDGETVEVAEKKGFVNVEYIPSFVNEHLEVNQIIEKNTDILFTGVGHPGLLMDNGKFMYENRRRFIKKVDTAFPGQLKVFGHQWGDVELSGWHNDFISEDEVHQISGKTKIVIAFDGPYAKGFTSVRMFRIIMSGVFVLVKYFPGLENIFENKKHIVWFHGDEEGIQLLNFYLNNDDERERISKQGKEFLLSKKGWKRKNILVDYLIEKSFEPNLTFNYLYPSFNQPRIKINHNLERTINKLKSFKRIVNLFDVVTYAEHLIEAENLDEAEAILMSVLEYDPNYLEALNDLSVIMIMKNMVNESVRLINRVLSIDKENELAVNTIKYLMESGLISDGRNLNNLPKVTYFEKHLN